MQRVDRELSPERRRSPKLVSLADGNAVTVGQATKNLQTTEELIRELTLELDAD